MKKEIAFFVLTFLFLLVVLTVVYPNRSASEIGRKMGEIMVTILILFLGYKAGKNIFKKSNKDRSVDKANKLLEKEES